MPTMLLAEVPVQLRAYGEYDYNYTYGHYGNFAGIVDADVLPNFSIDAGVQLSTANIYSVTIGGAVKFPIKVGYFSLNNSYLYKAYVRNSTQQACALLTVGYTMDYVSVHVGLYSKLFTSLPYDKQGYMVEPFNFVYDFEAHIFKPEHKWNLGARISNVDDFLLEHPTDPRFALKGNCWLLDKLRLDAEIACRPSGVFDIASNFYNVLFRVGVCYKF